MELLNFYKPFKDKIFAEIFRSLAINYTDYCLLDQGLNSHLNLMLFVTSNYKYFINTNQFYTNVGLDLLSKVAECIYM